jgi:DNA-directed RNA polymerase subunit RPC12/RpoP
MKCFKCGGNFNRIEIPGGRTNDSYTCGYRCEGCGYYYERTRSNVKKTYHPTKKIRDGSTCQNCHSGYLVEYPAIVPTEGNYYSKVYRCAACGTDFFNDKDLIIRKKIEQTELFPVDKSIDLDDDLL